MGQRGFIDMDKQPAVTLNNCFIKIRQESRDEISAQTEAFLKGGGKIDKKPDSHSSYDEAKADSKFNKNGF